MTTGLNYGNHEGNVYTSYFGALTETARAQGMGIVYWPGLRTGDAYSMTTLVEPTATSRSTARAGSPSCNGVGASQERAARTTFRPRPPARCCAEWPAAAASTFPGFSTTNGTALDLWDCNGGGNQSWNWTAAKQLTVYGNKCMTVGGDGSSAGSPVIIADCTGAPEPGMGTERRPHDHQRRPSGALPRRRRRRHRQRHPGRRLVLQRTDQPAVDQVITTARRSCPDPNRR